MWIKIILSVCIVAFGTLIGYLAAEKWRARRNYYVQFCSFHERFLNELNYARKPLADFLREYTYKGDFAKLLQDFSRERRAEVKFKYLTKEEKTESENYFSMLGKGDAFSQKGYFSAQTALLAQKRDQSQKDAKSRSDLYLKLGLLAGLAVVILIV